jgi:1-acyl-sn-glycerol-3-phosphate acyltransferase
VLFWNAIFLGSLETKMSSADKLGLEEKLADIEARIAALVSSKSSSSNHERRVLYAELELLRIETENTTVDPLDVDILYRFDKLRDQLRLTKIKRHWYDFIDRAVCGTASYLWMANAALFLAPPAMLIKPIDDILVKHNILSPHGMISEKIEKFIATTYLNLAGIELIFEGENLDSYNSKCPLVCFSHASAMDTFVIGALVPVRQHTLAKKELFLIPIVNLLFYTFGGIPVDRSDRSAAVLALQSATESAKAGGGCVVIAPEGTRSKSGQLLPFKKGPFYIWDELQSPIVPLVITGAYELCPPG